MPTVSRTPRLLLLTALAAPLALAACAGPLNNETTLGNTIDLEAFTPEKGASEFLVAASPDHPDPPSLDGLSRDRWARHRFVVPSDYTFHQPSYAGTAPEPTATPMQTGEFPNEDNALITNTDQGTGQQFLEGLLWPITCAADIVLMIPRAIITPPLATVASTGSYRERAPGEPVPPAKGDTPAVPASPTPATPAAGEPNPAPQYPVTPDDPRPQVPVKNP